MRGPTVDRAVGRDLFDVRVTVWRWNRSTSTCGSQYVGNRRSQGGVHRVLDGNQIQLLAIELGLHRLQEQFVQIYPCAFFLCGVEGTVTPQVARTPRVREPQARVGAMANEIVGVECNSSDSARWLSTR